MKRSLHTFSLLLLLFSFTERLFAQLPSTNYTKVYKAQKPITGDLSIYEEKDSVIVSISYYDGLGREIQSVVRQQSPLGKDVISFTIYDSYGTKTKSYLPYAGNQTSGAIVADPVNDQKAFYVSLFGTVDGNAALSETVIERSELSRVIEQSAPGYDWRIGSGHTVTTEYLTNTTVDSIRQIAYSDGTISIVALYEPGSLNCRQTIDEHGNDVKEFVDKEGRTICKRVKEPEGGYAQTYYVYDAYGNLVVVIPPEGVKQFLAINEN